MSAPRVQTPASGSRLVTSTESVLLIGQPPEVLKGLLMNKVSGFDTLILTDIKEKDGSLTNNLEFPIYFFLFVMNGLGEGRRLNLVGEPQDIMQVLRLLRITLLGPTRQELDGWNTEPGQKEEWLSVSQALALKNSEGRALGVEDFFETIPFENGECVVNEVTIRHRGVDSYTISNDAGSIDVNLNQDLDIDPCYTVQNDYIPGGLVKMGLEVLGGASGFTPDEPCTGLALCYNGDYLLIDSIPFLDQHLFARGISKNQISAVFLTHLHDDHCAMFPLMLMPHKVEIITTREIFNMAMEKLACSLGWQASVVEEHFRLVEVRPGETFNYFGMDILPHVTVHSIPTIGATFSTVHRGYERQICIVGDNHTMAAIKKMNAEGKVRNQTLRNLQQLYNNRFAMLVADGGAGSIHGDPADTHQSNADRVVFVHVEELPNEFDTTFSLASSGKRYTIIEGDASVYTSQVNHYLTQWLGDAFPNRWMRSLLAEEEIKRYNADDVIIVQDSETRGYVYLILTGYCDVVQHDGTQFTTVATLQAGDILGEMAVVTGVDTRNASVVARSPVTVCVFSESVFGSFVRSEGFEQRLIDRWAVRPLIRSLPQFSMMNSTVVEKLAKIAAITELNRGDETTFDETAWHLLAEGSVKHDGGTGRSSSEFGWRPFMENASGRVTALEKTRFVTIPKTALETLRFDVPQLNYYLRKLRVNAGSANVDWLLGEVSIY